MKKYLLRYLLFWIPALAVSMFYNNEEMLSQVLQWFFCFFMIFGWSVNTAMAAYRYPRGTTAALLCYTGFHILIITFLYTAVYRSGLEVILRTVGGLLSFRPLDRLVVAIRPLHPMGEAIATGILVCGCALGLIAGFLRRRSAPNPYSPRMYRS